MRTSGAVPLVAVGLALGVGLACGSGASDPTSNGNQQACRRYAEHLNTLSPCVGLTYDPENWCEGADQLTVDMTTYYDCLRANSACDGPNARLEVASCTPPLVLLAAQEPALGSQQPVQEDE